MSNIQKLKLVSGEWVIGEEEVRLESSKDIILKKPLVIHIVPQGPQQYGIALLPFDPTDPEGTVEIAKSLVVAISREVSKGLTDAYLQRTTGIEIVSSIEAAK
jgi:hypothetical protein